MKRAYGLLIGKEPLRNPVYRRIRRAHRNRRTQHGRAEVVKPPKLLNTVHITSQEIREEALKEVVSQIVDLVKAPWIAVNPSIPLTLSTGVSFLPEEGSDQS